MSIYTKHAFTVIEVVVVVTVLAVLAAMFIPRLAGAEEDTRIIATANDLASMSKSFDFYKTTNGYWPPDTEPGEMPPEMRGKFKNSNPFASRTPIGGIYNYDNIKDSPAIFISITGTEAYPEPTMADALLLDTYMDDGNLKTGNSRATETGYAYAFNRK